MAEKEIPGFTRHKSGGWVRSYHNHTVWCGSRNATREQVEETFQKKKRAIDEDRRFADAPTIYRQVLSEFLAAMRRRVETRRPRPMSQRTLHNYAEVLNDFGAFVGGDTVFSSIGPKHFTEFATKHGHYKASGFDSIVTRVAAFFRWAVEMEYIDRFRPGPEFTRPPKAVLRDERIDLSKQFTVEEYHRLYAAANRTMRCWLGLGLHAAMTNSEISHLQRACVDLDKGIIDFRRRKTGRQRRVCPLPAGVIADLRAYNRPEPAHAGDRGLFFLTERGGVPYCSTRRHDGKPTGTISRLFRELETDAGVDHKAERNFTGLRTTWYNTFLAMPRRGDYEIERRIIMGRAHGTVDLDSYLEDVGLDRLRHIVTHVETVFSISPAGQGRPLQDAAGSEATDGNAPSPVQAPPAAA